MARIGMFGTSWWADSMYLPPLANMEVAEVVAVCGRTERTTQEFAERWAIGTWTTDAREMYENHLDGVIIATANNSHHELTMQALDNGCHVLCEKPLGLDVGEAEEMAARADETGAITMVPFTYRYMPVNRFVRQLVADGYVGRPLHANLRYYTDFGHDPSYSWRFDRDLAGSGVIGDLGSHWIDLARWLLDSTELGVSATTSNFVDREARPDTTPYEQTEDSAAMTVDYENGAYALLHVSSVCWEGTPFGQTHHIEIHGTEGTLYAECDWDRRQEVRGLRRGENTGAQVLEIPDQVWGPVRRDSVHNTYRDVFRQTNAMTRAWVSAVAGEQPLSDIDPTFADGLAVQRVIDAALESASTDRRSVRIAR